MNDNSLALKIISSSYLVISWNVNSYTSDIHQWLILFVQANKPDVIFLSETKKKEEDLKILFSDFSDYNIIINSHNPSRWHGVAMLIRKNHSYEQYNVNMNIPTRSDSKSTEAAIGRIIAIKLNNVVNIIGSYIPNSGKSDQVKLDYRTKIWDPTFYNLLEIFRNNGHTIWMGDINVSLNDIDVSNPKTMKKYAGFTSEERQNFSSYFKDNNWYDIWRYQNPDVKKYTWCGTPRRLDYGMRLDNIIISQSLINKKFNTFMIESCPLSTDHIIVGAHVTV